MKGIFNLLLNIAKKNPYPIGSIYMSVNATEPSTLFGGTWERIKDTFLLSAGDTYASGSTGGEATHTLTVDEMPNHRHTHYAHYQWSSGSTNTLCYTSGGNYYPVIAHSGTTGYAHIDTQQQATYGAFVGGGEPHNNLPPYLAVFVWKRTA